MHYARNEESFFSYDPERLEQNRSLIADMLGYKTVDVNPELFPALEEAGIVSFPSEVVQSDLPGGGFGLRACVSAEERSSIDPWGLYAVGQYVGIEYPDAVITGKVLSSQHVVLGYYQRKRGFHGVVFDRSVALGERGYGFAGLANHSDLPNSTIVSIVYDQKKHYVMISFGWAILRNQELCLSYGIDYFKQGVCSSSMLSVNGNMSRQVVDSISFFLEEETWAMLSQSDALNVDQNIYDIDDASFLLNMKNSFLFKCRVSLVTLFSSGSLYFPWAMYTSALTDAQKALASQVCVSPASFLGYTLEIEGMEPRDLSAHMCCESLVRDQLLQCPQMRQCLLNGDWGFLMAHPSIQMNMPLPFEKMKIDFADPDHRLLLSSAHDMIGLLYKYLCFEVFPFETTFIQRRVSCTLIFWLNLEKAIQESLSGRDVGFFYTKVFFSQLSGCGFFDIHKDKFSVYLSGLSEAGTDEVLPKGLIIAIMQEISKAKSRCEQLIDRAPRHPSASLTAAVDQFYKYCSPVLGKLKKCLLRGQRNDKDAHGKLEQLFRIYTPHWRLGQVAKTVSEEEHSQYIRSLAIKQPDSSAACHDEGGSSHDENADVATVFAKGL